MLERGVAAVVDDRLDKRLDIADQSRPTGEVNACQNALDRVKLVLADFGFADPRASAFDLTGDLGRLLDEEGMDGAGEGMALGQ